HHQLHHALIKLRPGKLGNRSFRTRIAAFEDVREGSISGEAHHLEIDVELSELLAHDRILAGRLTVTFDGTCQVNYFVEDDSIAHHGGQCAGPAFIHQGGGRYPPTL